MKFGEKVRDLRKKHSLTQDELAQCLGINKRTIIGWERDGRYPRSIEMLEKMADIFHVPLTYLQPDQSLFIERAAEAYGKKGKIEAQHLAFELTELFASGELTPQDMDGIMYTLKKIAHDMQTFCLLIVGIAIISVLRGFHRHSYLRPAAFSEQLRLLPFSLLLRLWHLPSPSLLPT